MKDVTEKNFDAEVLAEKGKVLVDFRAGWCGPCRAQTPILEQLDEFVPEVKIVTVDVDESQDLAARYGVESIPTLILFDGGALKGTRVGLTALEELEDFVRKC